MAPQPSPPDEHTKIFVPTATPPDHDLTSEEPSCRNTLRNSSFLSGIVVQREDSVVGHVKGYVALLLLIFCWVGGAEITQYLQTNQAFNKPYFITWFNHVAAVVLIPMQLAVMAVKKQGIKVVPPQMAKVPKREVIKTALFLSSVYLVADYVWYITLPYIPVSEGTALFNTSPVFVYILSVVVMGEPLCWRKVVAVGCAIGGVCVLSLLGSGSDGSADWWAVLLVVLSASLYGVYEVFFKIRVTNQWGADSIMSVNWVVGMIGVVTASALWPGIAVVHFLPSSWTAVHESFGFPEHGQWLGFLAGAAGALGFNIFLGISLTFLPPVVVSVGCVMTIPVSAVADRFLHNKSFNGWHALGAALIVLSFLLLSDEFVDLLHRRWRRRFRAGTPL